MIAKYITLFLVLALGLFFIFQDNKVPKKETPKVSIVEENKTIEEVKVSKEIVTPPKASKPIVKEEQEEETEILKWCIDKSIKKVNNNSPLSSLTKTNTDGDIIEIFQNFGGMSREKLYEYENGILRSKTSIFYSSNGKVYQHIINIIYDEDADIANNKQTKEDIFYLTSFGSGVALPDEMDIEYHEEYDEEGKKIFAYTGNLDKMHRSATYSYDEEGNLLSKTFIHYGEAQGNTTTFYNKNGKVVSIYVESDEKRQNRWSDKVKSSLEERKKMYKKLRYKVFKEELIQAFKYNKNGQIIEEYNAFQDTHIKYIYDKYGNLIEKIDDKENVLLEQSFKICEE